MYVDKDEGDSNGGVGGEGGGSRCCDASAVPSRVTPAYLAGDHNRVAPAYSAAVTIASTPPYVPAPFPPTISISSRPRPRAQREMPDSFPMMSARR